MASTASPTYDPFKGLHGPCHLYEPCSGTSSYRHSGTKDAPCTDGRRGRRGVVSEDLS